jgi:hypothetical protein
MPHSPGAVPNPKYRVGLVGGAPLQVRAQQAADMVRQQIPASHRLSGVVNGLVDEFYIDRCFRAVEEYDREKSAAAQPDDPRIEPAVDELRSLRSRYTVAWDRLRKAQKLLALVVSRPRHQILQDIPPDFAQAAPQISTSVSDWPEIKTNADARELVRQMAEMVTHIEGRLAQLDYAMTIESKPLDERCELMIEALFKRFTEHEDSVRQELRDLQRAVRKPPKRKSMRSATSKRKHNHGNEASITG